MSYNILKIYLVMWTANMVSSVFFHEPSSIPLEAKDPSKDAIDFGFSLGYQKRTKTLVVSAPLESNTMHSPNHTNGKVFTCPIISLSNDIKCDPADINVEKLAEYTINRINPKQKFLLGASIATTSDYIFTCAPLWTSNLKNPKYDYSHQSFSFGTCFTYNGTAQRYQGYPELYSKNLLRDKYHHDIPIKQFRGGIGFNTLVDEDNEFILIAKPFSAEAHAHIFYLNTMKPLDYTSVLNLKALVNVQNLGFGMAGGKFLSNEITYAVSAQDSSMTGRIYFLEKNPVNKTELKTVDNVKIYDSDVGSMFGYTMAAADIDGDGFTELIVGAPAQRDETPEYGAVHIYVGGRLKSMQKDKKTILGDEDGGRFGMTIAASDIDGDDIPEIIVGAPYEDSGKGAVYIISGYEVKNFVFATVFKQFQVSKLKPQKILKTDFKLFGYSLQVVDDLDANGCNELAVGSPGSSRVLLFRSLQAVKVNVGLSTIKQKISDKDYNFDVEVCISLEFNKKATHIEGKIMVNNFVYGNGVQLNKNGAKYDFDLSKILLKGEKQHCQTVSAELKKSGIGVYTFNTNIEMSGLQDSLVEKDFSKTIAVFSSDSKTKQSIMIERRCDGNNCQPILSMKTQWSGGSAYVIGTTENESLKVTVHNAGFDANSGCVHIFVKGAQVHRINADCSDVGDYYTCRLRTPLERNGSEIIELDLDMTTGITNLNNYLDMEVFLYEDCNNVTVPSDRWQAQVAYELDTKVIRLTNENSNFDITEKSLSDEKAQNFNVDQVYLIHNSGKFKWLDLDAVITITKPEFEFTVKEIAGIRNCIKRNENVYELKCKVDLKSDYITKVILRIEIQKESIGPYITKVQETTIESVMALTLTKVTNNLVSRTQSTVTYNKDSTVGTNKPLLIAIGILMALLLLGGLCFILYKNGFFQGQNKKKLDKARDTVRRKSIKKSTTTSQGSQERLHEGDATPCDMEIVDDAFEEPSNAPFTNDSHKLVEEKAQVHHEKKL